jgi:hypothetical protein
VHLDHHYWLHGAVVFCLVLCAAGAMRVRWLALPLVGLSLAWLYLDKDVEDGVLLSVTTNHGLVVSDLVALAGFVVAAWALLPPRRK